MAEEAKGAPVGAPQSVVIEGTALPHAALLDGVCRGGDDDEGAREVDGEWVIVAGANDGRGRATGG